SNLAHRRSRAPHRNRCARSARRAIQIAVCLAAAALQCAMGSLATAQPLTAPPVNRLPAVDAQAPQAPLQTAQLLPTPALPQTVPAPIPSAPPRATFRKVRILPRQEGLGPNFESAQSPSGESAVIVSGGVNVVIQGLSTDMNLPTSLGPLGDVDIEADRVVIWGVDVNGALSGATQQSNAPLQIYMEGN